MHDTDNPVEDYLQQHPHTAFNKWSLMRACGIEKKKVLRYHVRNSKHIRRVRGHETGCGVHKDKHSVFQYVTNPDTGPG
jgi:hypothetical protein